MQKKRAHIDSLLGEEIFMVQFPRDFALLLTSIFQSSFFLVLLNLVLVCFLFFCYWKTKQASGNCVLFRDTVESSNIFLYF